MQRERQVRENTNNLDSPFDSFGGAGFRDSIFPSLFGGRDPFDDPFFARAHGSSSGSNMFSSNGTGNLQQANKSKGPVITEMGSDSDTEEEEDDVRAAAWSNKNPLVEHPEDQANYHGKSTSNRREVSYTTNYDKVEESRPQTHSVSFQRVTYGGINGAYYTATSSRMMGSDGVTMEENKQANRTTGQATHRVARGIHDKGHSVTRKLGSDGKVDTMQTLHNLNEDELAGFEQAWGGRRVHGQSDTFGFPGNFATIGSMPGQLATWGGFPGPFGEGSRRSGGQGFDQNLQGQSARGRPKKVVTINIE